MGIEVLCTFFVQVPIGHFACIIFENMKPIRAIYGLALILRVNHHNIDKIQQLYAAKLT